MRKIHGSCHKSHLEPGGMYFEGVEKAKRFRDSSPLERIEMRIGDERHAMNGLASIGALDSATRQEFAERIKELEKEKAELLARVAPAES